MPSNFLPFIRKQAKIWILLPLFILFNMLPNIYAQSTNGGIIFQALARDAFHNPANNRMVYVQTNIVQHNKLGNIVLAEEHITNTDYSGVFTLNIGLGAKIGGSKANLEAIDWADGPYFLNIKIAITPQVPTTDWYATKEWVDLGTSAFGVVPYALHIVGSKQSSNTALDSTIYLSKLNVADSIKYYVTPSQLAAKTFDITPITNDLSLKLKITDTASMLNSRFTRDTISLSKRIDLKLNTADSIIKYVTPSQLAAKTFDLSPITNELSLKLKITDTASMLSSRFTRDTISLSKRIDTKLNITDTAYMLAARFGRDTISLSNRIDSKVDMLNKSINISSTSDYTNEKFPSVKAVKDYVDLKVGTITNDLIAGSAFSFNAPLNISSNIISIPRASSVMDGYLDASDWRGFNNKINLSEKASINGVATLGPDGKIPSTQIPAISFSRVDVVTSETDMLALPLALTGSFAIRTDINKSFVLSALPASNLPNWIEIVAPGTVTTINGKQGPVIALYTSDIITSIDKRYITDAQLSILANTSGINTGDQDLSAYATNTSLALKANITDLSSGLALKANTSDVTSSLALKANTADVTSSLETKVDKVTGKELSSNDYTTTEKIKLAAITGTNTGDQDLSSYATNTNLALKANITDLTTGLASKVSTADLSSGLALKANTTDLTTGLASKASTADLTSGLALKANTTDVSTSLATKVDKVTGKELSSNDYTTIEKTKLAAITGTNTGDQTINLTGVVTGIGTGTFTTSIANGAITNAMLSNAAVANLSGTNTGDQDLSTYATNTSLALKANITDLSSGLASKASTTDVTSSLALKANAADITISLATKVDKVTGKELSSNDYTTAEKTKLATITGTNTGDQTINLTGVVTGTGTGTISTSIANGAITNAMLANTAVANLVGTNTGDQVLPTLTSLGAVAANIAIIGASKTKITYDSKGLVTAGADATTADIAASTNKNYVTDAMLSGVLSNTSGINTGDQDLSAYATNTNLALKASTTDLTSGLALKANLISPALVTPNLGVATATTITSGTITSTGDITAKRYKLTMPATITATASTTIDLSIGNVIQVDLNNSITSITFTNEAIGTYIIKFKQTVGAKTVNFPDSWLWSGGAEPTVTSNINRTDIVTLINDGANYYATIVQNFY